MRFIRTSGLLALILAASACLGSQVTAQTKPVAKPKVVAAQTKPVAKPKVARKAKAAPPVARAVKTHVPVEKPAEAPAAPVTESANKRDPFEPLINQKKAGGGVHLPPGKAGLVISTVRVDGAVHAASGMIAVVSNPENSVYFIHEGDRLYDGDVEKIGLDGVTFRENSKDAFGKPVERMVTKRIYASAGEQQ